MHNKTICLHATHAKRYKYSSLNNPDDMTVNFKLNLLISRLTSLYLLFYSFSDPFRLELVILKVYGQFFFKENLLIKNLRPCLEYSRRYV